MSSSPQTRSSDRELRLAIIAMRYGQKISRRCRSPRCHRQTIFHAAMSWRSSVSCSGRGQGTLAVDYSYRSASFSHVGDRGPQGLLGKPHGGRSTRRHSRDDGRSRGRKRRRIFREERRSCRAGESSRTQTIPVASSKKFQRPATYAKELLGKRSGTRSCWSKSP